MDLQKLLGRGILDEESHQKGCFYEQLGVDFCCKGGLRTLKLRDFQKRHRKDGCGLPEKLLY